MLTYISSKTTIHAGVFSTISERNTTLRIRYFSLILADISQLHSHERRFDFKSPAIEIGMLSNVSLEK